jgi:hypothetical protein
MSPQRVRRSVAFTALVSSALVTTAALPARAATTSQAAPAPAEVDSLAEAAEAAYAFTYPLVTMEVSRRQATNVPVPVPGTPAAPTNQPGSLDAVPEAGFDAVVRPNVDTLYTSLFYDVSREPLVVSMPDTDGRFHLAQVMDAWSNVEASPGSRTLGADVGAYAFALVGPGWEGELPAGVIEVPVDTSTGWLLTRIAVDADDPDDVAAVNALQEQITATPLSVYGTAYDPPVNTRLHPDWPAADVQVADYLADLSAQEYWDLYAEARSHAQVAPEDRALLRELAGWGWSPYTRLDLGELPAAERRVWEQAKDDAFAEIAEGPAEEPVAGWSGVGDAVGDYGTDYEARAATAYALFAANLPEDAVYAMSQADASGTPYAGGEEYVLHLEADEIPDVEAFWSITLYDEAGFLVENPVGHSAIRGEDLVANPDGSVDLYLQSESPGAELESNWLPTPADGGFTLALRAYWPGADLLDGTWSMPGVTRAATA